MQLFLYQQILRQSRPFDWGIVVASQGAKPM